MTTHAPSAAFSPNLEALALLDIDPTPVSAPTQVYPSPIQAPVQRLDTQAGASVTRVVDRDGERLIVRDASDRMIVEIDASTGRTVVHAQGALSFSAPKGDLELSSGGAVRVRGQRIELASERLDVGAEKARLALGDLAYAGTKLLAKLDDVRVHATRIESTAVRLFQKAKSVFKTIEDLEQTRAGRVRTIASGALYMKGETTTMEADGDVRVDGATIHLG